MGEVLVWRLRSTVGEGWLRELIDGAPIVTADEREACQFTDRSSARSTLAIVNRDRQRVPMVLRQGRATPTYLRGLA